MERNGHCNWYAPDTSKHRWHYNVLQANNAARVDESTTSPMLNFQEQDQHVSLETLGGKLLLVCSYDSTLSYSVYYVGNQCLLVPRTSATFVVNSRAN